MSELSFSLLCFNVNKQSKNEYIIEYLRKQNCDLCFLQEVQRSKIVPPATGGHRNCTDCYKEKLASQYDVIYLCEDQRTEPPPCSCLFYKKSIFQVVKRKDQDSGEVEKNTVEDKLEYTDEDQQSDHEVEEDRELQYALDENTYTDEMKPEILKEFEAKLIDGGHNILKKRASLAMLEYIGGNVGAWKPIIIVVSFHGPYKTKDLHSGVTQLFNALDYLGQTGGYPILVAGDFNCDLLKRNVNTRGFIVPRYKPTIHRVHKNCIDFFAYKNYAGCANIELDNVHADLLLNCPVKIIDDHHHLDQNAAESWPSMLKDIDKKVYMSDHDPLRATLTIKPALPTLTISYYNVNNDQIATGCVAKLNHTSDLVILNDIDAGPQLSCYNVKNLLPSTIFYYNYLKLKLLSEPRILDQKNICCLHLHYCDDSNLKITFTFVHKEEGINMNNMENILTNILGGEVPVIVMGDFNSTELPANLPLVIKQWESLPYGTPEHINKCFIAYMNNIPCSVNVHSTIKTIHNINKTGSSTEHVTVYNVHSTIKTIYNITKYNIQHQQASLINVLCFNMEGSNKINIGSISSYFTTQSALNAKPDLFILQNTQEIQTEVEEILSINKLMHNTCCESTIIYNRNLFQLLTELEFVFQADTNDSQPSSSQSQPSSSQSQSSSSQSQPSSSQSQLSSNQSQSNSSQSQSNSQSQLSSNQNQSSSYSNDIITACVFKCLKIAGYPEIVVASFKNSTNNIDNAKKCFELFYRNFHTHPILIAGGFNVELDTLNHDSSVNCDFKVTSYDPTIPRVLVQSQRKQSICRDYFAHKSSAEYIIKLEDVCAETISCPSQVTGSKIYHHKGVCSLPDVIVEHDPIRAKMIIAPQELPEQFTQLSITSSSGASSTSLATSDIIPSLETKSSPNNKTAPKVI